MLFDSHTHLNYEGYTDKDREELFSIIEKSDISYAMDAGYDLESSYMAVKHAQRFKWCYAIVGCHPHEAGNFTEEEFVLLKALAQKEGAKAIGEIGLDFYRNLSDKEDQRFWFRRQIRLANELKMPIVIHSRDAHQEVMDILKEEGAFSKERKSWFPKKNSPLSEEDARVLLHCYSGSREQAIQYIKLGATVSLAGPVTYKNARILREVAEGVPLTDLLIETDAPYLTPEPLRGQQNISPNVRYVAQKVAEIKGLSYEEVALETKRNGMRFFNIKEQE
ncbi:MAG: TatD family hydrolase [Anaerovoracaceae bacterium]|nr:TatD family hydrolase [Clostridiales bacterium]